MSDSENKAFKAYTNSFLNDYINQYKNIVELAGEAIVVLQDNRIVYANKKCSEVTGYSIEEILTTPFIEFIYEEDRERVLKNLRNRIRGLPAEKEYDFRIIHKDGSIKWFHIRPVIIQWNGRPAVLDFLVDITERKKLEEDLKKTVAILQATIDATEDALLVVDNSRNILAYNRAFLHLWKIDEEKMKMGSEELLQHVKHLVKDPDVFVEIVEEIYKNPNKVVRDTFELKDGRVFERFSAPFNVDEKIAGRVWYSKDITLKKRFEEELEKLATTDTLTGIYNRRKFDEILTEEISRTKRYGGTFCLIMFDIDNFKYINDRYGHDAGDYVLKSVVEKIKGYLRESDKFSRWGGEEFLILCPKTSITEGVVIADRIKETVKEISYRSMNITISVGVVQYSRDDTKENILKRVDKAMYLAKNTGKDKVVAL